MSEQLKDLVRSRLDGAIRSVTLDEIALTPTYSHVHPNDVDLSTHLGPVKLNLPLVSAAMNTVTGPHLARKLSDAGGVGIITNTREPEEQLGYLKEALDHRPCLVRKPLCLYKDQLVADAERILKQHGFSTVPVLSRENDRMVGMLFTQDVAFAWHREDMVEKWMRPLADLKTLSGDEGFPAIRTRLLNEPRCNVLPVVQKNGTCGGMYFKKDVVAVNPSSFNGRPLVGVAVGMQEKDAARVREALTLGAGIIVIDSSHGDCKDGIMQTNRLSHLCRAAGAALVAGNIADVDGGGYRRLAEAGADAVKVGIGSGSICTTSSVTAAGVGMVTALTACALVRRSLRSEHARTPAIIADGGIEGPGHMVKALLAGADAVMSGKWFVAAQESMSVQRFGVINDEFVRYYGMASSTAIAERIAGMRYGKHKTAPEGVDGFVPYRGPLMSWLPTDMEQVRAGFAHAGAGTVRALQMYGEDPTSWTLWTPTGLTQQQTRVTLR